MRIRSIKPEFWSSEDVAALDWEARLVFIGLWSYVDDNGVGRDVPKLIVADLFPLEDDPRETLARVSRALLQLSEHSLITRYEGSDGRHYLFITGWQHQRIDRPAKPRYPRPTSGDAPIRDTLATPSRHPRENLATGTGEQGNRGTDKRRPSPRGDDAAFDAFWTAYPRKIGKKKAREAWDRIRRTTPPETITTGALRLRDDPNRVDAYTPHPTTWLNRGGWDDDPLPPRADNNGHRPQLESPRPGHSIWDRDNDGQLRA